MEWRRITAVCPPEGRRTRKYSQASIRMGRRDKEGLDSDVINSLSHLEVCQHWEFVQRFLEEEMDLTEKVCCRNSK